MMIGNKLVILTALVSSVLACKDGWILSSLRGVPPLKVGLALEDKSLKIMSCPEGKLSPQSLAQIPYHFASVMTVGNTIVLSFPNGIQQSTISALPHAHCTQSKCNLILTNANGQSIVDLIMVIAERRALVPVACPSSFGEGKNAEKNRKRRVRAKLLDKKKSKKAEGEEIGEFKILKTTEEILNDFELAISDLKLSEESEDFETVHSFTAEIIDEEQNIERAMQDGTFPECQSSSNYDESFEGDHLNMEGKYQIGTQEQDDGGSDDILSGVASESFEGQEEIQEPSDSQNDPVTGILTQNDPITEILTPSDPLQNVIVVQLGDAEESAPNGVSESTSKSWFSFLNW